MSRHSPLPVDVLLRLARGLIGGLATREVCKEYGREPWSAKELSAVPVLSVHGAIDFPTSESEQRA